MSRFADLPVFDDQGLHLVDPSDKSGRKTRYISLVHALALRRYVGSGAGAALDIGCGYGRMSGVLKELGFDVVGVDPSLRVLKAADGSGVAAQWVCGALPDLPFKPCTFRLVLLQNVLRVLHLLGRVESGWAAAALVAPGGRLIVVDNSRRDHPDFVPESQIIAAFEAAGLRLCERRSIRAARWPLIYLIRYGLVPQSWYERIARWELRRLERRNAAPGWMYHNVLLSFERPQ